MSDKRLQTNAERKHEIELAKLNYRRVINLTDQIFKSLRLVIGGAVIVLCCYFIWRSVDSLSGKTTTFSSIVNQLVDLRVDQGVCIAIAMICGVGWRTERKLRRKTITDKGQHISALEKLLAPERKSSGLLPDGTSTQKDKDDA